MQHTHTHVTQTLSPPLLHTHTHTHTHTNIHTQITASALHNIHYVGHLVVIMHKNFKKHQGLLSSNRFRPLWTVKHKSEQLGEGIVIFCDVLMHLLKTMLFEIDEFSIA